MAPDYAANPHRFFEDLAPARIARRLDLPLATVKTRLRRALVLLRRRLDIIHGDRRPWLSALLPILEQRGQGSIAATVGGLLVSAKTMATLGGASVLLLLGGLWIAGGLGPAGELEAPALAAAQESEPLRSPELSGSEEGVGRQALGEDPDLAVSAIQEEQEREIPVLLLQELRGRVLDTEGTGVAGIQVRLVAEGARPPAAPEVTATESGSGGVFVLAYAGGGARLEASSEHYRVVMQPVVHGIGNSELIVVVAPTCPLAGHVVDAGGGPLAGAEITLGFGLEVRRRFEVSLDQSTAVQVRATSDESGYFSLPDAWTDSQTSLRVKKSGYEEAQVELPQAATYDMQIVLGGLGGHPNLLRGEVLDGLGQAVEGAFVALGEAAAESDATGSFVIDFESVPEAARLIALKPGYLPAVLEREPREGRRAWPEFAQLFLGSEPLRIAGRVLDASGLAVPGASLWITDPTLFGVVTRRFGDMELEVFSDVERLLGDEQDQLAVAADDEGRFVISGLMDRSYTLRVSDKRSLTSIKTQPIAAGSSSVEIVIPAADELEHVVGQVVNGAGEPIPGVQVRPVRKLDQSSDGRVSLPFIQGPFAFTGDLGRFEFESIVREGTSLQLWGGSLLSVVDHPLPQEGPLDGLVIVALQRCHLRVDLGDRPQRADRFRILDDDGQTLRLTMGMGNLTLMTEEGTLEEGHSEVLAADDSARTLVLYKDGLEVQRMPLRLQPEELNRIEL